MVQVYKDLNVIYWVFGGISLAGVAVAGITDLRNLIPAFVIMLAVMLIVLYVLELIGKKRFLNEIIPLYNNCRVKEYMAKTEERLGKDNSKRIMNFYNYLKAMGHFALGENDALLECAKKIEGWAGNTEYLRWMAEYYVSSDMFDEAREMINRLSDQIPQVKKASYREQLKSIVDVQRAVIRMKNGDYEGTEEFYDALKTQKEFSSLISQVSINYRLGDILAHKGDYDRAREHLRFAADKGGDTKYRELAEVRLKEIS